MATFSLAELLPNKWRHIAVVIADIAVFFAVILAPVTARYGFEFGTWAWNFWALAIFQGLSFLGLLCLYFPPTHPYDCSMHLYVDFADNLTATESHILRLSSHWTTLVSRTESLGNVDLL